MSARSRPRGGEGVRVVWGFRAFGPLGLWGFRVLGFRVLGFWVFFKVLRGKGGGWVFGIRDWGWLGMRLSGLGLRLKV